jgi:RNA polymerase sigma-70 factor (ECF subfamily)
MIAQPDDEDHDLMLALASGNDTALNLLMRRWSARLIAYLERLCGSHATACDLAQEAFVRVYKHRHRFRPAQKFSTWLFAIATNLARNHSRWQRRHPVTLLEPEELHTLDQKSPEGTPDTHLEKDERARAVRRAILSLPAEQKETLILATYEGMSHAEIADVMETTPKVVEMRLYRARKALADMLSPWVAQ